MGPSYHIFKRKRGETWAARLTANSSSVTRLRIILARNLSNDMIFILLGGRCLLITNDLENMNYPNQMTLDLRKLVAAYHIVGCVESQSLGDVHSLAYHKLVK